MVGDIEIDRCCMNIKIRPAYVVIKTICFFVVINILYGLVTPPITKMSVYNTVIPGLERMPFDDSTNYYTVMVDDVDAMFAAHKISAKKKPDEIRVALIGDSSIWGENLSLEDTLAGQWNRLHQQCDGKTVKVYNLGYPHPSIIKDLMFIEKAKEEQPDAIVWFISLNTVTDNQNRVHPFLMDNSERALEIMDRYHIPFAPRKVLAGNKSSFYQRTLVGQRSFLARWIKLQALGLVWLATGKDLFTAPASFQAPSADVQNDPTYRDLEPGSDLKASLLLEAFPAGKNIAGGIPIVLVNEPVFVATGAHSDIRYNDLYPRWAYDQYRENLAAQAQTISMSYLDMWNVIPPQYFTDTPLHLNAEGEQLLMEKVNPALLAAICP
jgi:hypothetical protein